jgi:hypothetical protein
MTADPPGLDTEAGYEGTDPSGAVRALADPYGVVTEVRLARDWRTKMHRNELGTAVLAAIDAAGVARVSAWAERAAGAARTMRDLDAGGRRRRLVELAPNLGAAHRLLHLVDRVDGELADVPRTPEAATGASGGGHVTVRLNGRQVVGVDVDTESNWTVVANHREIENELADALNRGYTAVMRAERTARAGTATAELWALTANPQRFVDELFGARRP